MRQSRIVVIIVFAYLAVSFAQTPAAAQPKQPQIGYYSSAVKSTTPGKWDSGTCTLPAGEDEVAITQVSFVGDVLRIKRGPSDVYFLKQTKSGIYETDFVPERPQAIPKEQRESAFTRVSVVSPTQFVMEDGSASRIGNTNKFCAPFVTTELNFISEERPDEITGTLRPGVWQVSATEPALNNAQISEKFGRNCLIALVNLNVDLDGFITAINGRFRKMSPTSYQGDVEYEKVKSQAEITVNTPESFTGTLIHPDCTIQFEGKFIKDSPGVEAATLPAVDASIVPKSGTWEFKEKETIIEGDCTLSAREPFSIPLQVRGNGGHLNLNGFFRLENGYYTTPNGQHQMEVKSPELFVYQQERMIQQQGNDCLVKWITEAAWKSFDIY